jgi:DNA-binding HxlR family transcriptional regulator
MTLRRRPRASASRSPCPIAGSLDLVGDRWTLLVVRDLLWGKQRFQEFLRSPEKIPTNLLAERLARLEAAELITRSPYQDNPPRFSYALTRKGRDLGPVLSAFVDWGTRHIPGSHTLEGESA